MFTDTIVFGNDESLAIFQLNSLNSWKRSYVVFFPILLAEIWQTSSRTFDDLPFEWPDDKLDIASKNWSKPEEKLSFSIGVYNISNKKLMNWYNMNLTISKNSVSSVTDPSIFILECFRVKVGSYEDNEEGKYN